MAESGRDGLAPDRRRNLLGVGGLRIVNDADPPYFNSGEYFTTETCHFRGPHRPVAEAREDVAGVETHETVLRSSVISCRGRPATTVMVTRHCPFSPPGRQTRCLGGS